MRTHLLISWAFRDNGFDSWKHLRTPAFSICSTMGRKMRTWSVVTAVIPEGDPRGARKHQSEARDWRCGAPDKRQTHYSSHSHLCVMDCLLRKDLDWSQLRITPFSMHVEGQRVLSEVCHKKMSINHWQCYHMKVFDAELKWSWDTYVWSQWD